MILGKGKCSFYRNRYDIVPPGAYHRPPPSFYHGYDATGLLLPGLPLEHPASSNALHPRRARRFRAAVCVRLESPPTLESVTRQGSCRTDLSRGPQANSTRICPRLVVRKTIQYSPGKFPRASEAPVPSGKPTRSRQPNSGHRARRIAHCFGRTLAVPRCARRRPLVSFAGKQGGRSGGGIYEVAPPPCSRGIARLG